MQGVPMMAPRQNIGAILAALSLIALCNAGPLGPLPNVTSEDVGLKEGSCVLGDVVYMPGDTFAGATPCERCACAAGSVQCAQERCEPRPGCKALHRPDHCCPTYQCECEQEGRVYGNGEKLVDPEDPCRVCYCQGGEVVCRRIACFLRDDCQPRLVPGRCCPEYDNCPLRGITAIPGLTPPVTSSATTEVAFSAAPTPPKENIKQEITIKEITPVSEIPVITDVKIKEILPSPSIEVPEYPSSKSPLIPREAIPDKTVTSSAEISTKSKESVVIDLISPLPTEQSSKPVEKIIEAKGAEDLLPSKISLSTQDSINSEIYPSHVPTIIATMGVPAVTPNSIPAASTTRVTIIEEEDSSLFDHNPAFPPIPDDLSPVGTHEDEISEQTVDNEHTNVHGEQHVASTLPPTSTTIAPKDSILLDTSTTTTTTTTENPPIETSSVTTKAPAVETSTYVLTLTTLQSEPLIKGSPMLNPWSAIPSDILNVPSSLPEDISGDLDDPEESVTTFEGPLYIATSTTEAKVVDETTTAPEIVKQTILPKFKEETNTPFDITQSVTSSTTGSIIKLDDTTTTVPQKVFKNKYLLRSSEVTSTTFDTTQTTQSLISTTNSPVNKIVDETAAGSISKETILPRSGQVKNTPLDTLQSTETVTLPTTEPAITESRQTVLSTITAPAFKLVDETTDSPQVVLKNKILPRSSEVTNTSFDTTTQTTQRIFDDDITSTSRAPQELVTASVSKSNIPTEITAQTEFSSLPIETSDQNPHDSFENALKDKGPSTTDSSLIIEITTGKATTEPEKVTATKASSVTTSTPGSNSFENIETTEFVLTSFGSSESSTDAVELIKISPTQKLKNAAIIDSSLRKKTNVLTDLSDLVKDLGSISDHTDEPGAVLRTTASISFGDSEELMPVNAGYKSKNSNFNLNSITEIPLKTKSQLPVNKQKVIEIEGEDTDSIADASPPHDKVEPTTRRPIIDNVSDSMPKNETGTKDIEIISQSYVPTINRRPTKVVMKKNNDKPLSEATTEQMFTTASSDVLTTSEETKASPVVIAESDSFSGEPATTADPSFGVDPSTTSQ